MSRLAILSLVGLLAVASGPQAEPQQKSELVGIWRGLTAESKGIKGALDGEWEFKIDTIIVPLPGGKKAVWKYSADPSKNPKEIDLFPDAGPAAGKKLKGIFVIEKDSLKMCYIAPNVADLEKKERPTSFEPGKRDDTVVLTFMRKN
jgi:uncharacterized protein (TIGR03067 family)